MGGRCTICKHPEGAQIDRDLVQGKMKQADVANRYGVSQSAISRHYQRCIGVKIRAGAKDLAVSEGRTLVDEIEDIKSKTRGIYADAIKGKDMALALAALDRLTKQIDVFSAMMFKYEELQRSEQDVRQDMDWIDLRGRIISALEPYPDALNAVVNAIDA